MRWINSILLVGLLGFMACELHDPVFDNSLDLEVAAKKGIYPPAIVLFPNHLDGNVGTMAEIQVYALKVDNVGMAQIAVYYDPGKLAVESVVQGSLFQGGNEPFFLTDNDPQNGVLTIYITFLGPAGNSVGGTGDIALINFKPNSTGRAEINISQESILLDPNAKEIVLKGYGKGMIDVR